ncbi:hypothetical protein GBAR_LOCUS21661 [Geodia barretti]|uniref:Uncharacterized protein n=1 Tax=Geodia barretti TaxID=519541 RepID=A0AA35T1Z1_GEOBA|nr:hypothetical protein GBAR_LOCUS21661 [Geodia barretti]
MLVGCHSEEPDGKRNALPSSPVSEGLSEGARLISDLQSYQWQRLSEPPSLDKSRHTVLPPPSQQERGTATKLVTQLAVLTAQTRPGDLVQVSSLRGAMGLPAENEAPSLSSPQDPMSPPSQSATDTDQQHTNST